MADQTTVETPISTAPPIDQGPAPWTMSHTELAAATGRPIMNDPQPDPPSQLPKGNFAPWEMYPEDLAKLTAQIKQATPVQPTAPVIPVDKNDGGQFKEPADFDGVFTNLVKQESGGKHFNDDGTLLTSAKDAKGITQVTGPTGVDPGFGVTPLQNNTKQEYLRFGRDYLRAMYDHYSNNVPMAVAAYNHGPGNVDKLINKYGDQWAAYLPQETKTYVKNILGPSKTKDQPPIIRNG